MVKTIQTVPLLKALKLIKGSFIQFCDVGLRCWPSEFSDLVLSSLHHPPLLHPVTGTIRDLTFHSITIFSFIQTYLYFLSCLLSLMPSPKSRQWVQRLFVILKYLVKKFRTEYTSSFTTYWWMVTKWASVGQQKVWPPPSPRRSKWRIPVQNCLIILLSSSPLAARLFKASPGGKILPFCAFVRSVGTWQQLNNQKCT